MKSFEASFRDVPIWTPLAAVLLALAWLIPNSSPPWGAFHKDLWAALALGLVAVGIVVQRWRQGGFFEIDSVSGILLVLAVWTLGQWQLGKVYFLGHAALGFGYLFAAVCAVSVARSWEALSPRAVGNFLFFATTFGALGTAGLILKQWLGVEGFEVWAQILPPGSRPFGNLMQPNNAATLLLLGMVGLLWALTRGVLGQWTVFFVGLLPLAALTLTQSRIGYLSFLSLSAAAFFLLSRSKGLPAWRLPLLLWCAFFALFVWLLPQASQWLNLPHELSIIKRSQGELRGVIYQAYLVALMVEPLWGFGFGQGAFAQLAAAAGGYELPGLFTWTHNILLDIAIWFGLPAALAFLSIGIWLIWRILKRDHDSFGWLYIAALFVVLMHAMVELPHAYAYFLLPASLILGALCERVAFPGLKLSPRVMSAAVVALITLLAVIAYDYMRIEGAFYTWRFKLANVGTHHPADIPDTVLLDQFQSLLVGARTDPGQHDSLSLERFEQAVLLAPSGAASQALVVALVHAGEVSKAQAAAENAKYLSSPVYRKVLADSWRARAEQDVRYNVVKWPE